MPVPQAPAVQGQQLFTQLQCATCHRDAPDAAGPALAGLFGSEVRLADGRRVPADEHYVREAILSPGAKVVAGYQPVMPSFQRQLPEEGVLALIDYIKSLPAVRTASTQLSEGAAR